MPRLQDIEELKNDLAALGREAETLERWGEARQDVKPPEGSTPEGGEAGSRPAARRPGKAGVEAPDEGVPPDFASLLEGLPLEDQSGIGPTEDEELAALLGSLDIGAAQPQEPREEAPGEPSPAFEEPGAPDFDLAAFAGPEPAERGPAEGEPGGGGAGEAGDNFGFDLSSLDFGDLAALSPEADKTEVPAEEEESLASLITPAEPTEAAREPAPVEPAEAASFDLGSFSFGSADLGAPPEEAPEETFGSEPGASERMEEGALEVLPEAGAEEAPFELPGLEAGFDFGEAAAGLEAEAEPSILGQEEAAPPEAPATTAEQGEPSLGDIEDFSFDLGSESFEPAARRKEEEEFSVPNLLQGIEEPRYQEPEEAEIEEAEPLEAIPEAIDLDKEIASLSEEAPAASTFNLDTGWGGFGDFGAGAKQAEAAAPKPRKKAPPQEAARAISLTEAQVDTLQDALLSFPLNLRVAVEDILANAKGTDVQQAKLVWMLVEGGTATEIAGLCGRILKRTIEIPKGYQKRTGAAFEARKGSLGYILVHSVLPILKVGAMAIAAVGALAYLGWRFVYTPLAADSLYRRGYGLIAEDRFPEAEASFKDATALREFLRWYYLYAEAYAAKRQYILAEGKYSSLLDRHPGEKKAALAWARLAREQMKYASAIAVLRKRILETDYFNEAALLLSGDIYLDWAEEDGRLYEEARRSFAGLIERYGAKDEYLERMLLYFMRTGNRLEAFALKRQFLAAADGSISSGGKIRLSAPTLAELGGFILDSGEIEDAYLVLMAASVKDPAVPETYYHLARYFRRTGSPAEERKALDWAASTFGALPGLSGKRAGMYIESLVRRGRLLLDGREWLGAEQDFTTAAEAYETALDLRRLKKSGKYSEAYAGLAEVAFWQRDDLEGALSLYRRAAADGFETYVTQYRQGYILYRLDRAKDALELFHGASKDGYRSPYLDYAFGAAFFARGDWFSAEAYFRRVVERMRKELAELDLPSPQEHASEAEIVELLLKAENNLGAALYRVATRVGDSRIRADAMASFAESSRYFDSLARDQTTLKRPETKNLGFLNMDFVLHPLRGFDISVYPEIERDPAFPRRG